MGIGEELTSVITEPLKKSVLSVFEGINSRTEALDILNKFKNAYFSKLREQADKIKILGMQKPIKLVDVYVPTKISNTISRRLYEEDWRNIDDKSRIRKPIETFKPISADHFIDTNSRVVILAPAGSGKTTFFKYLTLAYIDDAVFKKSNIKTKKFPFLVSLPLLAESKLNIDEYLVNEVRALTDNYAEYFVYRKLIKRRSIVLLDSLDEVPTTSRREVINKINKFCAEYADVTVAVSCRVADYNEPIDHCHEVEIIRLSDAAIEKIINAWFKADLDKANTLYKHLKNDADVYSLTETPLLLSLLCIQFNYDLNIPNRKAELYRRCIETLLREWDTTRKFRRDTAFSSLTDDRKEKVFEQIAYHYTNKNFTYIFHDKDLFGVVEKCIDKFGIPVDQSRSVVDEMEKHHGIIERYSSETYFFSHPSFQEYFTARSLISKKEEMIFVKNNYENIRSWTVITFLAALLENPEELLSFLIEKSTMTSIKNFPAMARRTGHLHLLYKCLSSGIAVSNEYRNLICKHLYDSQIEIYRIFLEGKIIPLAILEPDGVRHTYYYVNIRPTTNDALQSVKLFSNDILQSPSSSYTKYAVSQIGSIDTSTVNLSTFSLKSCLMTPLANGDPENVKIIFQQMINNVGDNDKYLKHILNSSLSCLEKHYMKQSKTI